MCLWFLNFSGRDHLEQLWQYYDDTVVPDMISILSSGHPLSYVAARQLALAAVHPDFATDAMATGLVPFVLQLVRMASPMLRVELVLLLAELSEFPATRRLLWRNQRQIVQGYIFLVDLLCYPTAQGEPSSASDPLASTASHSQDPEVMVRALAQTVWRQERSAILKLLCACVGHAPQLRELLRGLSFAELGVRSPGSFVTASAAGQSGATSAFAATALAMSRPGTAVDKASRPGSAALDKTGNIAQLLSKERPSRPISATAGHFLQVPLVQLLSRPERMLYRTITAILALP